MGSIYIEKQQEKNGAQILRTRMQEDTRVYRDAKVSDSIIGPDCTIGDQSSLLHCELQESNRINRRNQMLNVHMDFASHTNHNTTIRDADIGKFCSISWNVSIGGTDHNYRSASTFNPFWWNEFFAPPDGVRTFEYPRCGIGSDVWIASGANILRKVHIGDGAVIAAGAVVTRDVEPYAIVAGVPAVTRKMRFDDRTIERLEKIRWWDWPRDVIRANVPLLQNDLDEEILEQMEAISAELRKQSHA
ncbi:MAG: CatB-related O-acetyltransferase [Anaerovoracaceae bacterium]